jgi:tRNA A-37 threonylcarbamoyl transferase component Bud32/DNA-binding beta-propeller fold protein YncE
LSVVADSRIGTVLAGYRIEERIGRGGMSVVYRADDIRLKRKVALKLLSPELAEDDSFRERFLRESELAASLDHPNVVPIYDAGEVEGLLYIAMRYVEGEDLKALLRREGALPADRALRLAGQVASALDAAHERGLVHRDVKPSNVLLTGRGGREHCYLSDFGLSTSASDRTAPADPRHIVGTIDYVAPEQIRGEVVGPSADVYSLACLIYECLTGHVPFRGASDVAVVFAHLEESPPAAGLGEDLDGVLSRGMAKEPEQRWESAGALLAAAGTAVAEAPPARTRRRALLVAVAAAAATVASVAALVLPGGGSGIARADTLVRIDPDGGDAAGAVALAGQPTAVTVCAGNVWVTASGGRVAQVDPGSLRVNPIRVSGAPSDVADVGDLAAVVSGPPEAVTMIDAQFGRAGAAVALPGAGATRGTAVAFGRDVWVSNPAARALDRLQPPYTGVAAEIPLGGRPRLVAAGEGAVWVAGGRTLWRVHAGSGRVGARVRLTFVPAALAAGNGGVWLVDRAAARLVRMDPATMRVTARIRVGRDPRAVAVGAGSVWVANGADGTVSRVDPRRNAVAHTISVRSSPVDLEVGLGSVWVVRRTTT